MYRLLENTNWRTTCYAECIMFVHTYIPICYIITSNFSLYFLILFLYKLLSKKVVFTKKKTSLSLKTRLTSLPFQMAWPKRIFTTKSNYMHLLLCAIFHSLFLKHHQSNKQWVFYDTKKEFFVYPTCFILPRCGSVIWMIKLWNSISFM